MSTPGCFANVTFGDDRAVSNYALAKMKGSKIIHGTVKPRCNAPVFNIHLFFYKKTVYKNIQAEIPQKIRTSIRTYQPQIMTRKRILIYFSKIC